MDKRRYPRIRFGFRVEDPAGQMEWMTEDISIGGLFLKTLEKLPVGSKLQLVFQLPGSSRVIEAIGEVKHHREEGMGLEFSKMDQEGREEMERFIKDFIKYR
jgi:uncharacterized protein (TIGR02266 family)